MNPLLLTVTFLTVMALLTSSEALHQIDGGIKDSAFESHKRLFAQTEELAATSRFDDLQAEKTSSEKSKGAEDAHEVLSFTGKSAPLNYDHARPPNNARINIYLLMMEGSEGPLYEQTARFMRNLYAGQPFFDEIPNLEYRILDALISYQDEAKKFFFVDELATLPFKDKEVQRRFLQMLKGKPPLLHYITLDAHCNGNQKKLNFMFAAPEVLHVAIPDSAIYEKALAFRNQLWEQIEHQEKNRKDLPKDEVKSRTYYKTQLSNYLENLDPQLAKRFDLSLGKKGGIIFVRDPLSGVVKRERLMKKKL